MPIGIHLAHSVRRSPVVHAPGGAPRWSPMEGPFVIAVVSAFLLIDVMGLCNTYGILTWASGVSNQRPVDQLQCGRRSEQPHIRACQPPSSS